MTQTSRSRSPLTPHGAPIVSIIIPAHNAAHFLERCLVSVQGAIFRDCEVIVVDDNSTDATAQVAAGCGATVIATNSKSGPATARNLGASVAKGEFLVFLDADVCTRPDTLECLVNVLVEEPDVAAVFGSYDREPAAMNLVSQFRNLLHHHVHQAAHDKATTFWSGCGAIRKLTFDAVGGFDSSFNLPSIEDIEFGSRLSGAGYEIRIEKQAQVTHLKKWTLWPMLVCDVRDRGIPWTRLILESRDMPNDLNVTHARRISVICSFLLVLGYVLSIWWLFFGLVASLALAGVIMLNLSFYKHLAQIRGSWFAILCVPLHVIHYLACGVAFAIGLGIHVLRRSKTVRRTPYVRRG